MEMALGWVRRGSYHVHLLVTQFELNIRIWVFVELEVKLHDVREYFVLVDDKNGRLQHTMIQFLNC